MFWRRGIKMLLLAISACGGCVQSTQNEIDTNTYTDKETDNDGGLDLDTDTEKPIDTDPEPDTGIDTDTHSCQELSANLDFPPVDLQTAVPCDPRDKFVWRSCALDNETQGMQTCSLVTRENDAVEYYWSECVETCDAENSYRECNTGTQYEGTQICKGGYGDDLTAVWTACAATHCLECYPDEKRECGPETEYPGMPMECFVALDGYTFWSDSPCYVK